MAAAPPKPWEKIGINHQNPSSLLENSMSSGPQISLNGIGASPLPAVSAPPPPPPPRSTTPYSRITPNYGSMSSYGGIYSPYSSYGGYGNFGYNRFGYGMQTENMTSTFARVAEENSRPAFQSIESIVQAVTSVSMMLDSSFQAVYNSFRAVIGVADNFSRLRSQLMHVFSALAIIRTLRYLFRRLLELLRLRPAGEAEQEWKAAVTEVAGALSKDGDGEPRNSSWPILMFFTIVLGGPYLIWKLIASFSNSPEPKSWAQGKVDHYVAQAIYSFNGRGDEELSFTTGQQIIIAPKQLQPQVRGWLLGSVDGVKVGLVPANYIKILGQRQGCQTTSSAFSPSVENTKTPNAVPIHRGLSSVSVSEASGSNSYKHTQSFSGLSSMDTVFNSLEQTSNQDETLNSSSIGANDIFDNHAPE